MQPAYNWVGKINPTFSQRTANVCKDILHKIDQNSQKIGFFIAVLRIIFVGAPCKSDVSDFGSSNLPLPTSKRDTLQRVSLLLCKKVTEPRRVRGSDAIAPVPNDC